MEILETMDQLEELTRQMPTLRHQMLARLHREASPVELGAKNLRQVLTGRLNISSTEAGRRLDEAAGIIGPEHVSIIRTTPNASSANPTTIRAVGQRDT